MIDRDATNWVDRGQAAEPELVRVLAAYVGRDPAGAHADLRLHATAMIGMVLGGSTEVHLAGYLRSVEEEVGVQGVTGGTRRSVAGISRSVR